jgi:hypothetical protein
MSRDDEHVLREAFAELRAYDEQTAPNFDVGVARFPLPASRLPRTAPLAMAAAIMIICVALYQTLSHRQRFSVPDEVVALSAWRASTDVLLEASTQTLLSGGPQLGASTIDIPGDLP